MVIYVLDASALLRFLPKEAGARHVLEISEEGFAGTALIQISAINWAEVISRFDGENGRLAAESLAATLIHYGLTIEPIDQHAAKRAALIKRDWKLGLADAFCGELALRASQTILVTADFDFKETEHLTATDFLPENPLPGTIGPVQ